MSKTQLMMKQLGLTLLIAVVSASASLAVVIQEGDGKGNTTAPEDDPGFANVGLRGAGSAVYLGNRWVITAKHVGPGPVVFGDTTFDHVPGEVHRLRNPNGLSEFADIVLMRLAEEPDLPSLRLGCRTAGFGQEATLVGYGHDRELELTHWTVQIVDGKLNDIWTEVATESEADHSGFETTESRSLRWGDSLVTQVGFDANTGSGDVLSFQTSFQPSLNVEDLGQAVRRTRR